MKPVLWWAGALCLLAAAGPLCPPAHAMDPIRYTVRFPAPQSHYAEIQAIVPTAGQPRLELFMAVWTPGSYLVREYARNVEGIHARDAAGNVLGIAKSRKNRWLIQTGGAAAVTVTYRVYCREMSVRTNWVDERFALLNGAATFLSLSDHQPRPHDVTLQLPPGWAKTMTGLPAAEGSHHYIAPDFDTLVDCPILAGNPAVYEFTVAGKKHVLVNEGESGVWDGPRSAADVEKIVREYYRLWGFLPYDHYVFLNILSEAGGGLEHKNSVVMMASRWSTRTRRAYLDWLALASHEFFHAWNVKRLRPLELGPFDYETENHTQSLWVAEGFTEYYALLSVTRAGLASEREYLGTGAANEAPHSSLSTLVEELQTTPGRLEQPLALASYDSWIKLYRPDENSNNVAISYYTKGAVTGWLLDARIRHVTKGRKSLDDVMRLAYERYSGPSGYSRQQFQQTASEVAGVDLADFFQRAVESAEELDYTEALDYFGLRFHQPERKTGAPKAWLGMTTRNDAGRLLVTQIPRGTPAEAAGLSVEDEILAIDGFRVRADQFAQRAEQYRPNDQSKILVARRDRLVTLEAKWGEDPGKRWQLEVRPDANGHQKRNLAAWLRQGRQEAMN